MKLLTGLLAAVLLLAGVGASQAVVRIADDRGGRIGTYVDKYQGLRTSGETVIIDGLCASACTIVLGAVPHDRICVTSHANLGFHAAWDFGSNGRAVTNAEATHMLYSMYPPVVRKWIAARGGLTPRMIFLRGKQLQAHVQALLPRRAGLHQQAGVALNQRPFRRKVDVRWPGSSRPLTFAIAPSPPRPAPPHDVMSGAAIPLACPGNWPYLKRMAQPISTQPDMMAATPSQGRVASIDRLERRRPRRAGRARRGGIVVPLRHRGVFRDDRRRHLGLLLIRHKGNPRWTGRSARW